MVIMLQNLFCNILFYPWVFPVWLFFLFSSVLAYIFGTNGQNLVKFEFEDGLMLRKKVSENEGHRSKVKVT